MMIMMLKLISAERDKEVTKVYSETLIALNSIRSLGFPKITSHLFIRSGKAMESIRTCMLSGQEGQVIPFLSPKPSLQDKTSRVRYIHAQEPDREHKKLKTSHAPSIQGRKTRCLK